VQDDSPDPIDKLSELLIRISWRLRRNERKELVPFGLTFGQAREKQRIAVARLLLKSPDVVVLDEATAHLDSESERAMQKDLNVALGGRTSLVIAHRLSTVRYADQILVVDAGRIVERGRHEELIDAGGLYAELYNTRFRPQASEEGASEGP
jgi:ATP-binding cassette, subfamily B, bacterial